MGWLRRFRVNYFILNLNYPRPIEMPHSCHNPL